MPTPSAAPSSVMEVLEIAAGGGGGGQEEGGVVYKGNGRSVDDPMVIGGEDYLQGEDSEVTSAFSGTM